MTNEEVVAKLKELQTAVNMRQYSWFGDTIEDLIAALESEPEPLGALDGWLPSEAVDVFADRRILLHLTANKIGKHDVPVTVIILPREVKE